MKAIKVILKNYEIFNKDPVDGVSIEFNDENPFEWKMLLQGPKDSPYEYGLYKVVCKFPQNYPNYPPEVTFKSEIFHPNIYSNGKVCISILHPPGDDKYNYESAEERWRPVHTINSILLSIISLLSSPNDESPANIDAAKMLRDDPEKFQKVVNEINKKNEKEIY